MSGINARKIQEIEMVTEHICDPNKQQDFIKTHFKDFDTYKRAIKLLLLLLVNTKIKDKPLTFNILNRNFIELKDQTPFLLKVFVLLLYNINLLNEIGFAEHQVGSLYNTCIYPLDIISNEYYENDSIVAESFKTLGIEATIDMLAGVKKEITDIEKALADNKVNNLKYSNLLTKYYISFKDDKKIRFLLKLGSYRKNYYKKIKRDIFLYYLDLFKTSFQHLYQNENDMFDIYKYWISGDNMTSLQHNESILDILKKSYYPHHNNWVHKNFKSMDNFFYIYNKILEELKSVLYANEKFNADQIKKIISNQYNFYFPSAFIFILFIIKKIDLFQSLQWTPEMISILSEIELTNVIYLLEQSRECIEIFKILPFNIVLDIIKADSILILHANKDISKKNNEKLVNFIGNKIIFKKQFDITLHEFNYLFEQYKEDNILTSLPRPILHARRTKKPRENKENIDKLQPYVNHECQQPVKSESPFLFELDQVNKHIDLDDVNLDAIINLINKDDINNKKRSRPDEDNMLEENESKTTSFSSGPILF